MLTPIFVDLFCCTHQCSNCIRYPFDTFFLVEVWKKKKFPAYELPSNKNLQKAHARLRM